MQADELLTLLPLVSLWRQGVMQRAMKILNLLSHFSVESVEWPQAILLSRKGKEPYCFSGAKQAPLVYGSVLDLQILKYPNINFF